jgi:hypothetical protein
VAALLVGGDMKVVVISKAGCSRCLLLKDKLRRLGVEWEDATGVEVWNRTGMDYPITIIDGVPYEYAAAMKKLKEMLDEDDA